MTRMSTGVYYDDLDVPCTRCKSVRGQLCRKLDGTGSTKYIHTVRMHDSVRKRDHNQQETDDDRDESYARYNWW